MVRRLGAQSRTMNVFYKLVQYIGVATILITDVHSMFNLFLCVVYARR
jgi:hypothetical protein